MLTTTNNTLSSSRMSTQIAQEVEVVRKTQLRDTQNEFSSDHPCVAEPWSLQECTSSSSSMASILAAAATEAGCPPAATKGTKRKKGGKKERDCKKPRVSRYHRWSLASPVTTSVLTLSSFPLVSFYSLRRTTQSHTPRPTITAHFTGM